MNRRLIALLLAALLALASVGAADAKGKATPPPSGGPGTVQPLDGSWD